MVDNLTVEENHEAVHKAFGEALSMVAATYFMSGLEAGRAGTSTRDIVDAFLQDIEAPDTILDRVMRRRLSQLTGSDYEGICHATKMAFKLDNLLEEE